MTRVVGRSTSVVLVIVYINVEFWHPEVKVGGVVSIGEITVMVQVHEFVRDEVSVAWNVN